MAALSTQPGAARLGGGSPGRSTFGRPAGAPSKALSPMEKRQAEKDLIDVAALHTVERPPPTITDDGSGRLDMWVVSDYELEEWPASRHGIFFMGRAIWEISHCFYVLAHIGVGRKSFGANMYV